MGTAFKLADICQFVWNAELIEWGGCNHPDGLLHVIKKKTALPRAPNAGHELRFASYHMRMNSLLRLLHYWQCDEVNAFAFLQIESLWSSMNVRSYNRGRPQFA